MIVVLPLALAVVLAGAPEPAAARPEFARREGRACGYCHINPRGGGARNSRGLQYARNEFKFPPRKGDLTVFVREKDRNAMIHAQQMVNLDHIKVAIAEFKQLSKTAKGAAGKRVAQEQLHALDVRGNEVVGAARRLLRKSEADEAIELLVMIVTEYKGLDVHAMARTDLQELRREKEYRQVIKREENEAKARVLYLDGLRYKHEKQEARALKTFEAILKKYAGTRAAKGARKQIG